ncbi:MAG: phage major capsid protein [Holosporaceae bacterium]|jgi:HK97 family phage major capsid protein|nr:phage major capsid protein [Holosporaceae bacterium]
MNKKIEEAISELNDNVDELIKSQKNDAMPLSKNLNGDVYKKYDFGEYIRNGNDNFFKKSLTGKAETSGGYLIPPEITLQINEKLKLLSPMRLISKIVTISSNAIDFLVDSKTPDAGWASVEKDQRDETNTPELKKIKIPVHEIFAKPKVSQKLLDDAQIDVEEWLITKVSEKIAALENSAFINGDGNDKPLGFLKEESEEKQEREFGKLQHFISGAKGKFVDNNTAVDILIDMSCSLKPIYVKNAKWIMSRSALGEIRKLRNKNGYLWQPSLSEASPATLLGYPIIIDDDMPALIDGNVSISVAFGDFHSGYQIVDRQGLKILRDPYSSKPFVEFYTTKRIGGKVVDFEAIKLLKFEEKNQ